MSLCIRCICAVLAALAVAGVALTIWPHLDLAVSGLFYEPGLGFLLPDYEPLHSTYHLVRPLLRYLVGFYIAALLVAGAVAVLRRRNVAGISARGWAFLLIALLLGPGLMVNAVLKESWGRARPDDTTVFGGTQAFTAALQPSDQCTHNCSFVAGDPSLGFYLQAFAYVARRRQRTWLAGGLVAGGLLGAVRVAMGAHFLSDVIFCALVVMLSTAVAYLAVFAPGRWPRRPEGPVADAAVQRNPARP